MRGSRAIIHRFRGPPPSVSWTDMFNGPNTRGEGAEREGEDAPASSGGLFLGEACTAVPRKKAPGIGDFEMGSGTMRTIFSG
jgi:hypothetical protein